jgi:hypothetical protein
MRQIHAAIDHLHRGDFECAITLAAAGEGMLPSTDKAHFCELDDAVTSVNDIVNWLRHGEIKAKQHKRIENVAIGEFETIVLIYRAITKFDAVFEDQKTPQMISFRVCVGPRLQGVASSG